MGGFRRKRGNKGIWFPVNGEVITDGETSWWDASSSEVIGPVPSDRTDGPVQWVFPLTTDISQQLGPTPPPAGASLRDFVEGQDWLLKTLVGNCTVLVGPSLETTAFLPTVHWPHVQVAAGIFVARAQDEAQQFPDLLFSEIDVLNGANMQDPWVFRRTWLLDNPANLYPIGTNPGNVFGYETASNRELTDPQGPFIHTKSVRRIRREERLWMAVSAIGWDADRISTSGSENDQCYVKVNVDLRIFGKMMRGKNASTF